MKHHSELINELIKIRDLSSYLEIGVFDPSHNFDKIKCDKKECVDPAITARATHRMMSDQFFEEIAPGRRWDIIFIDGLHHDYQVKRDFENALKHITNRGFIVMHDTNPHSERITHVPRDNGEWTGDVYKFASRLCTYPAIDYVTWKEDYGVTVVWKDWTKKGRPLEVDVDWKYFNIFRKSLLNLKSTDEILNFIPA